MVFGDAKHTYFEPITGTLAVIKRFTEKRKKLSLVALALRGSMSNAPELTLTLFTSTKPNSPLCVGLHQKGSVYLSLSRQFRMSE